MDISSVSASASSLISQSQQKAAQAAQSIASIPVGKDEVGASTKSNANDLFKPVLSLKEAELESAAGAKLLGAEHRGIGTLLDIRV